MKRIISRITKARRVTRVPLKLTAKNKERFAVQAEEAVRVDFVRGISRFKQRLPKAKLDQAFNDGGYEEVRRVIPWEALPDDLGKAARKVTGLIDQVHRQTVTDITERPKDSYLKDAGNPRLEQRTANRIERFMRDLPEEHSAHVQRVVAEGTRNGHSPDQIISRIKDGIGLNDRQSRALANFENGLINGGKHTPAQIDSLKADKAKEMLDYRLRMVAITETRSAVNGAELEAWKAQQADGILDEQAEKVWVLGAENACPKICLPMDGVAVLLNDQWELPDGRMVDLVTESHPSCRCASSLRTPDDDDYGQNRQ